MANQFVRQVELTTVSVTFIDGSEKVFYNVAEIAINMQDALCLIWLDHGVNDITIPEYKSYEARYQSTALVAGDEWHA